MASAFGGGAVDPETLYTKQACIGEQEYWGSPQEPKLIQVDRRRQFRKGLQGVSRIRIHAYSV